jgi:transcriptional regulator with XRE-family HTH domain
MLQTINELGVALAGYTRPTMLEWAELRDHFRHERRRRRLTQKAIAYTGDVDQGAISKIEKDPQYMPSAKTLLGAIYGLGYTHASDFFREIEQLKTAPSGDTRNVFVSHHAPEATPVSAATGRSDNPSSDQVRAVLRDFLSGLKTLVVQFEDLERATPPPAPHRQPRRPTTRVAHHR